MSKEAKFSAIIIFELSALYFVWLSAKSWTWIFTSGDSGDWLASSTIWMTPQPYGSPLYILLGHAINTLTSNFNLPGALPVLLSSVPGAITVTTVFIILQRLNYNIKTSVLGCLILTACGVFLSQVTVLEIYSLATCFLTIAFYFNISKKYKLTALFLGLSCAVHIIAVMISFFWFMINFKDWKGHLKFMIPVFVICLSLYTLTLILMHLDTPKLIAGYLSLQSLNAYGGSTGTIGSISLINTPQRLLEFGSIFLLSFGINFIPTIKTLRGKLDNVKSTIIATIGLCFWLYITNEDSTTWTFMIFSLPLMAILIIMGLESMQKYYKYAVAGCSIVLILFNSFFLNADVLTKENPEALNYYDDSMELPFNSAVAINKGGSYGLGMFYIMTERKDLKPIFFRSETELENESQDYKDYLKWFENEYQIEGNNWIEQINYCLDNDIPVFTTYDIQAPIWQERIKNNFETVDFNGSWKQLKRKE